MIKNYVQVFIIINVNINKYENKIKDMIYEGKEYIIISVQGEKISFRTFTREEYYQC